MTNPGANGSMISVTWLSMNVKGNAATAEGEVAYVIV